MRLQDLGWTIASADEVAVTFAHKANAAKIFFGLVISAAKTIDAEAPTDTPVKE